MSEIVVQYQGGLRCSAKHESGAVIVTDAPKENHGNGASVSPSELLSVSLGSCILSIMGITARSLHVEMAGATATVQKTMTNSPRRITGISVAVAIPGAFTAEQRRALEDAAHACPVHRILNLSAPITFRWENCA